MKKKSLNLQTKITILIIIVIFVSLTSVATFVSQWAVNNVQAKVETNIMNAAKIVANSPGIIDALTIKDPNGIIETQVDAMHNAVEQIDFIVVADMDSIRYSHPNSKLVGKRFVGGDEERVVNTGKAYISEAIGTLGKSLRAFVPIHDSKGTQIGFVVVGTLARSINEAKRQVIFTIIISSLAGLIIGIIGAFLLAKNIKRSLLGFEPQEISQLYIEKKGMLEAIHEGIIAIDERGKITLFNDSAVKILNIKETDLIGKDILEMFPSSRLVEVLKSGIAEYDREQEMNNTIILTNRVPIKCGDKIVGAIATFRDKTMVTRLAEEITGVKQVVEALRANTHEFMNKLHVILGLINLGALEQAKKYIVDITDRQQQVVNTITSKIKDPTVAALILGKISRAKELDIKIIIDEGTLLEKEHGRIKSSVLVTILGNLIENAFEAITKTDNRLNTILLKIVEYTDSIEIKIKDTGVGIKKEHLSVVTERGFTTKDGSRGVGLSLVKESVENLGGHIDIQSEENVGTEINVSLLKEDIHD